MLETMKTASDTHDTPDAVHCVHCVQVGTENVLIICNKNLNEKLINGLLLYIELLKMYDCRKWFYKYYKWRTDKS